MYTTKNEKLGALQTLPNMPPLRAERLCMVGAETSEAVKVLLEQKHLK